MSGAQANALEALCDAVGFVPLGAASGNLTIGKGTLDGRSVRVALVENRIASGSIGRLEVSKLVPLLRVVAKERSRLVVYLDSAGARVSEGLAALGAFRFLFRAAMAARVAGAPIAFVLGRNCFGGASMLAHVGEHRLLDPATRLAMSGPTILAQGAGASALDDAFAAIAQATIGADARSRANACNTVWSPSTDVREWLRTAFRSGPQAWSAFRARHVELRSRLGSPPGGREREGMRRRDLDRLFAGGYEAIESDGVLSGQALRDGEEAPLLGLVGTAQVGAARAWKFAHEAWTLAERGPARIEVVLDCDSHAARLEDEKAVLTEYIVDMACGLEAARSRGTHVELTILDRAGGGVYVALGAAASRITVVHGADVQVLPGAAVASILGAHRDAVGDIEEYRSAGVADAEIKLGIPP